MLEEFLVGMAADTNMAEMLAYFAENRQEAPVSGDCFFNAAGLEQDGDLQGFFKSHKVSVDDADSSSSSLLLPTFGGYKFNTAD